MNDTIPKAEQWLRDHDAEVHAEGRQEAVAEIRDRLIGFVARLKEAAQTQLEAVNLMETMLMDKPATPARRKRAPTVAKESLVLKVRGMFENLDVDEYLTIDGIAKHLDCGPRRATDACRQLEQQGWIKKRGEGGYAWIPEREAERDNGLRTGLDDGPEIE